MNRSAPLGRSVPPLRRARLTRAPLRRTASELGLTTRRKSQTWGARKFTPNDRLWSLVIRTRDGFRCRKCGRAQAPGHTIEAAHLFGAGKPTTRCDEDNGFALCRRPCHRDWAQEHQTEFHAWAKRQLGAERYDRLLVRSNLAGQKHDPEVVRAHLQERLRLYQSRGSAQSL